MIDLIFADQLVIGGRLIMGEIIRSAEVSGPVNYKFFHPLLKFELGSSPNR